MKKELTRYYRCISRCLPLKQAQRQQIMEKIRFSVEDYLAAHPEADMAAVTAHFGAPQEIAAAYIENMTPEEILKKMRFRKTVLTILCAAAATVLLLWGSIIVYAIVKDITTDNNLIVVDPIEEFNVTEYTTEENMK